MWLFVFVVAAAGSLVLASFYWNRWSLFIRRPSVALRDMYIDKAMSELFCFAEFESVMRVIGKAYRIPPEKLRFEDRFAHELNIVDSYFLGGGQEKVSQWLSERYPSLDAVRIGSVGDLLAAIGVGSDRSSQ